MIGKINLDPGKNFRSVTGSGRGVPPFSALPKGVFLRGGIPAGRENPLFTTTIFWSKVRMEGCAGVIPFLQSRV